MRALLFGTPGDNTTLPLDLVDLDDPDGLAGEGIAEAVQRHRDRELAPVGPDGEHGEAGVALQDVGDLLRRLGLGRFQVVVTDYQDTRHVEEGLERSRVTVFCTSANAFGKDMASTGSSRKLSTGSVGASDAARQHQMKTKRRIREPCPAW